MIFQDNCLLTIGLEHEITDLEIFRAYFEAIYYSIQPNTSTHIHSIFQDFLRKAETVGWEVKSTLLPVGPWRYEIDPKTE